MSDKTSIEWTATRHPDGTTTPGSTWNPIRGCSRVSRGCEHCYAEALAARFSGPGMPYAGLATVVNGHPRWTNRAVEMPAKLTEPLHWAQPRRIFVNSMSDLFHADVSDEYIARVFAVMAIARRHTFQILTKRPERMRDVVDDPAMPMAVERAMGEWTILKSCPWPLPNVWLGTSVEDQATADERIPLLLETPAAVRFISAEPLLERIDIGEYLYPHFAADDPRDDEPGGRGLDWVIVGGESGPGHRPFDPQWARVLLRECKRMGVAFFFKQHGGITAKAGGRMLDGRTWDEMPDVRTREDVVGAAQ